PQRSGTGGYAGDRGVGFRHARGTAEDRRLRLRRVRHEADQREAIPGDGRKISRERQGGRLMSARKPTKRTRALPRKVAVRGRVRKGPSDVAEQLKARTSELAQALERQAATAEILKVISSTPTDVQEVFDAIVKSALRLVGGLSAIMTRLEADKVCLAAFTTTDSSGDEAVRSFYPLPLTEASATTRALQTL